MQSFVEKMMVNVLIYLNSDYDPHQLVEQLLNQRLIAKATIDFDNKSYQMEEGEIVVRHYNVLTIQTQSLLFTKLEQFVEREYASSIPIYSLPITQSNSWFDNYVRNQTKK
jgi:uncharacterized protein involved in tolerance to divalent cations